MKTPPASGWLKLGCGSLVRIRTTWLAVMFEYASDASHEPGGASEKAFGIDEIAATTSGRWQFKGNAGVHDLDAASVLAGVAGDSYECRHDRQHGNRNLVACLLPGALDLDHPRLFKKQVVPARGTLKLLQRAALADSDDHFDSLIFGLFDETSKLSRGAGTLLDSNVRMQRVKRFIERHAFDHLGLSDIAAEVGISPFTCVRQFRASTGKTPYAYLLELRIERAKRVLQRSNLPIDVVSHMVGFDDPAYFSRYFKRALGLSPTSYRDSF